MYNIWILSRGDLAFVFFYLFLLSYVRGHLVLLYSFSEERQQDDSTVCTSQSTASSSSDRASWSCRTWGRPWDDEPINNTHRVNRVEAWGRPPFAWELPGVAHLEWLLGFHIPVWIQHPIFWHLIHSQCWVIYDITTVVFIKKNIEVLPCPQPMWRPQGLHSSWCGTVWTPYNLLCAVRRKPHRNGYGTSLCIHISSSQTPVIQQVSITPRSKGKHRRSRLWHLPGEGTLFLFCKLCFSLPPWPEEGVYDR